MDKILATSFLLFILPSLCFSQTTEGTVQQDDIVEKSIRDASIIVGTTSMGVLLGASTLSFVDVPKDHLNRILLGGSIGVMIGVGIVIYLQATKSAEIYNKSLSLAPRPSLSEGFVSRPANPRAETRYPPLVFYHRFTF